MKSFGGQRARRAFLGPFGLLGDRRHAVVGEDGAALTARRASALLGFRARLEDPDGGEGVRVETPEGRDLSWDDPELAAELTRALGHEVRMARSAMGVHDAAPVHIVSTASLGALAGWLGADEVDPRRFRPNIVIEPEGGEAFAEAGWHGATLEIGEDGPAVQVVSPTERCAVTTFDPETLDRDNRVLAGLARNRENLFGVYARVVRPGWVEVGASVRIAAGVLT